ncbi:hypothetical protein [Rhodanobacter sp. L36]|uniref:hypothetical protein n=1 Tax=Rhodanobacter sp. L36 TaxID=1747221 RepID=UPI00131C8937|nr:hypothetical protein [Rhodanobacter sp. L36]
MESLYGAVIAVAGAIIVGYLAHFVSEDYRRFRDGQTLAAALAGEIGSFLEAVSPVQSTFPSLAEMFDRGEKPNFPSFESPVNPVFDACVERLGLLGLQNAKDVAYVYQQLAAFRTGFKWLCLDSDRLGPRACATTVRLCIERVKSAEDRGTPLVSRLIHTTKIRYSQSRFFAFDTTWPNAWHRLAMLASIAWGTCAAILLNWVKIAQAYADLVNSCPTLSTTVIILLPITLVWIALLVTPPLWGWVKQGKVTHG